MKAKNESNREDYLPKVSLSIGDAFPANELRLSDGTTVDFYEGIDRRGFTFENPNAVKSCGCGSSFQA